MPRARSNSDYFAAVVERIWSGTRVHQGTKQLNQVAARAVQYTSLMREVDDK